MELIESSETSAYINTLTPGTYPKEKKLRPVIHCSERYVGPRAGLEGYGEEEISSPTGVRTPDSPARSVSLYALHCPRPFTS